MAKGQKRNNRETKKPKAEPPAVVHGAPSLVSKGMQSLVLPKKKA
ncbi:hypothetical protein [Roseomonas sp. 18066]|nr:hypothetical protein [Roseomonas sp. 18066]